MDLNMKTKEIIEHFNFKFNKNLGQNFLINEDALKNIIEAINADSDTLVIEIGSGIGTLTSELAKKAGKVNAIEIDKKLIEVLDETLANYQNIEIIKKDALKVNYQDMIISSNYKNVKIAANLPYYITTPAITKLMQYSSLIDSMVFMIQKEAADRIMAKPDEDEYGFISILCQYYSVITRVCKVSPSSFIPQPRVESLIIKMDIREKPAVEVKNEKQFFNIIKASFNMRRKTLFNALKPLCENTDVLKLSFEKSGIDPLRRGETLSIEEFAALANSMER